MKLGRTNCLDNALKSSLNPIKLLKLFVSKISDSIVLIRIQSMKQGEVLLLVTLFVWVVIEWRRLWSDYFEACNDSKSCLLRYNELWYKEYEKENNIQLHDSFVKRPKIYLTRHGFLDYKYDNKLKVNKLNQA